MKKNIKIISAVLFFILFCSAHSQNLWIGPAAGFTVPTADYTGKPPDYYKGTKYGNVLGLNVGAMGKYSLTHIDLRLAASYSFMGCNGLSDELHSASFVNVTQHLLTVSAGATYGFGAALSAVKPYVGADLLYSVITSSADFLNTVTLSNPTQTITMNAASREGLGVVLGTSFVLRKIILDLSLHYNMINLFGKKYEAPANSNRDFVYTYLNDAADPNYNPNDPNHPVANNRTISTIQIQLGVLFGFKL